MAKTSTDSSTTPDVESAAPAEGAGASGADRRQHVRVQPDASNAFAARLASGAEVRLIDLSRGGAQFECDRRFLPNATVSLRLVTSDEVVVVSGRVVRSRIVRLATGGLGYVVAVAFNELLPTPIEEPLRTTAPVAVPPPAADVVSESVGAKSPTGLAQTADSRPDAGPDRPGSSAPQTPEAADTAQAASLPADITAEEALAFEATLEFAPAMLTVTAAVDATAEQLRDMFNGNDW